MATINAHTGILTSPKFVPLTDGAFRLWFHALCWSKEHLTDGFIPVAMLPSLHQKASKFVPELLARNVPGKGPLWHQDDGGYRIHDFADWQDIADVVQTRRRKWREAKRGLSARSTQDSTPESTSESTGESREGLGLGVGGGIETVGTDTQTRVASARPVVAFDGEFGAWPAQRHSPGHAWRSTIGKHIPAFLHREFADSLTNGGTADPERALLQWYASTEDTWRGRKDGTDAVKFWRARFAEWQGTAGAKAVPTAPVVDYTPSKFRKEPA